MKREGDRKNEKGNKERERSGAVCVKGERASERVSEGRRRARGEGARTGGGRRREAGGAEGREGGRERERGGGGEGRERDLYIEICI